MNVHYLLAHARKHMKSELDEEIPKRALNALLPKHIQIINMTQELHKAKYAFLYLCREFTSEMPTMTESKHTYKHTQIGSRWYFTKLKGASTQYHVNS